jgi:demethoxyubiquinone hydroxylase (CLK1/Coq7/Cat5 family)
VHPKVARLDRTLEVSRQFRANELRHCRKACSRDSFMASFSKRTYFSWRLVCSAEPSLNATFDSEAL